MNQIITLKVIGRIVLVAFVFCVGKSTFAQQSMSSSQSKPSKIDSVRKAQMVLIGTDLSGGSGHLATSSTGSPEIDMRSAGAEKMGIQYYPIPNVDRGKAYLQERKFKWGAYYYVHAQVTFKAPADIAAFHHIYAIASVKGDGFPEGLTQSSGDSPTTSISIPPFSFPLPWAFPPLQHGQSFTFEHVERDQPQTTAWPRQEELNKWATGYAVADVDVGWASEATATAKYQYGTLTGSSQFTTAEAFYYPYSIR